GKDTKNPKCLPSLIFRQPFPEEWRFIVAIPNVEQGFSNSQETAAFQNVKSMPAEEVGKICRLIMMKLLPALAEKNI
ncbi:MAG: beta-ribofuranosylaminobenzene 5'-phosphate synthase, partial [Candidatus Bathyarchaeia archaeon]